MSRKVKNGVSNLSPAKTIVFTRSVLSRMEGNPNFPSPTEPLAEITAKVNLLDEIQQLVVQGHLYKLPMRRSTMKAVIDSMAKLCEYVNLTADGDETKLESSGFPFVKKRTPRPAPDKLTRLSAKQGKCSGNINLKWQGNKTRTVYSYQISYTPEVESSWIMVGLCTKPSTVIGGLESGKKCWFRVAAVNAAGSGAWSDPVAYMVG
jgi:hypothetical protein